MCSASCLRSCGRFAVELFVAEIVRHDCGEVRVAMGDVSNCKAAAWIIAAALCSDITLVAAQPEASLRHQTASQLSDELYSGWRASRILESRVFSKGGKGLGSVRNIVVADSGHIVSLISEQAGIGVRQEFVFQVPWDKVVKPLYGGILLADLSDNRSEEFALFRSQPKSKDSPGTFLITDVIGDYVRLQTGLGYGYVSDVVFGQEGRMLAVLVTRQAAAGGGIFAFPYPGQTGKWQAGMSYYGLPYIAEQQANAAGLRVDNKRFEDDVPR